MDECSLESLMFDLQIKRITDLCRAVKPSLSLGGPCDFSERLYSFAPLGLITAPSMLRIINGTDSFLSVGSSCRLLGASLKTTTS